ncbi:MAG: protein kinase [Myxococcota bacterium]|jgi:serine/threonine-protein kinase
MSMDDFIDTNFNEGQAFGKYTLLKHLASGGMADIFLARLDGTDGFEKEIAIKKIKPHLTSRRDFVQGFLNEAKLAALLTHPNICQIYELGQVNDAYFIAMEYIHGRDMNRMINMSIRAAIPFPMEYALKIASNCCEGLYYAHTKTDNKGNPLHIVHRDVTPENVIVSFSGGVKLLDFGIAKAAGNLMLNDRPGEIKGKLSFMSPEQCRFKDVDHRSDLFSLGAVLYEWITGYRLFTGDNDETIIKSVVEGKIYPPSYFKHDVPKQVEEILMRALEKDREKRYQSAWDMQYDIDTFLSQHEFTPSNVHLSNFVKQIFREEIDQERKEMSGLAAPSPATPPPLPDSAARRRASSGAKDVQGEESDQQSISIRLKQTELASLSEIAQKNRVSMSDLMSEIVRMYLKYK